MKRTVGTVPILVLGLLTGCASVNPKQFQGPTGKVAYSMDCSGYGRTLHDCYQFAGKLCPQGYTMVDQRSTPVGVPVGGGAMIGTQDTLAIECR